MKKTKKFLAMLAAAILMAGMMTGVTALASETDPFAKYETPVEITTVKNLGAGTLDFPQGDSIENNVWTRKYEEALGVKIRFLWTTNEQQYTQKVNIAITSNELPDVMAV